MKKKQTRRSKNAYPGLEKRYNLKIRQDLIDYDYVNKLSPEEKEWLNNFTEEYTNANFGHKGKRIMKSKKHVKAAYDANNKRNNDIQSKAKANNLLKECNNIFPIIEDNQDVASTNVTEDAMIDFIDSKIVED